MPRTSRTKKIELSHPKGRTTKRIYIATEGYRTEPKYFEALGDQIKRNFKIIILQRKKNFSGNSAPKDVLSIILNAKKDINFRKGDEFWIVIDKDQWDLSKIINKCDNLKIQIAVSNPCFEIWLLFHYLERRKKYEMKRFDSCSEVDELLKKYDSKIGKNNPVTKQTLRGLRKAVFIAKKLDENNEIIPDNPGSQIYKIIEKHIRY